MKNFTTALKNHYAGRAHTLAILWKITRTDGLIFGFTNHDEAVVFSGLTYEPSSVFDASAIATRGELNVDNLEAHGFLDSDGITAADIEAGRWDGADIQIIEVNYRDVSMGGNLLRAGTMGNIDRRSGTYTAEMRGLMQFLQNQIVRVVTPACNAQLGDTRCGVSIAAYTQTGTISARTDDRSMTISVSRPDAYFNYGVLTFTSGANNGLSMEIKKHLTTGVIELFQPMPYTVATGNTISIIPGCNKTHASRVAQVGTPAVATTQWYGDCKDKFNNLANFRGFPAVPGPDKTQLFGGQK